MADDPRAGKDAISMVMELFKALNNRRPNSFLLQTFFDAKAEEKAKAETETKMETKIMSLYL